MTPKNLTIDDVDIVKTDIGYYLGYMDTDYNYYYLQRSGEAFSKSCSSGWFDKHSDAVAAFKKYRDKHTGVFDGGYFYPCEPPKVTQGSSEKKAKIAKEYQEAIGKSIKEKQPSSQFQVGGDHYTQLKIQPFDIYKELGIFEEACTANILKYVMRYKSKNGLEDLKKAQHYLTELVGLLEDEA